MAMHWYVVYAYSQYENSVKKALTERIKRAGLEAKFGQILVPTEEVMEIKDGVKRMTERKFFPGYVLVQMEMDEETWHLVKSTPKVMGFIGGTPDKPAPISEGADRAHQARGARGEVRPDPGPDRRGHGDQGRRQAHDRAQVLPGLRPGPDGNGRGDLAPREVHAEGHGFHRRNAGQAGADLRRR